MKNPLPQGSGFILFATICVLPMQFREDADFRHAVLPSLVHSGGAEEKS